MRRPEIDGFIAVAPPANHYDLSFLAPCPASGVIIAGEKDVVAPPQDIDRSLTKVRVQKGEIIERANVPGANHFFQGKLDDLEKTAAAYLKKRMKAWEKAQEEAARAKAIRDAAKLPPPKQG
jgi:alpha/beta superfamily hydrolase